MLLTETASHPGLNLRPAGPSHGHSSEESIQLGFWLFLMSDLVTFGLVFTIYATMKGATAGGPGNAQIVDMTSIILQTGALLISSLLFSFGTIEMRHGGRARRVAFWMAAAMLFGLCFLGLEISDFWHNAMEGAVPMRSGYLSAYWSLVGLHGLHVASGSVMILAFIAQIRLFGLRPDVQSRVIRLGLFWHFLDIIWIGIFSVVFLPGVIQ